MSSDDDRQPLYAHWRNSNVSRNFHRLGLLVAAIILMAGLLLMAKDALGLRFWDIFQLTFQFSLAESRSA